MKSVQQRAECSQRNSGFSLVLWLRFDSVTASASRLCWISLSLLAPIPASECECFQQGPREAGLLSYSSHSWVPPVLLPAL